MITLDEIINGYMLQNELPQAMEYRIEQLAIRGYRQLHYHAIGLPKQETLDILANGTACLPCDFLTKLRIGPINGRGEIQAMVDNGILSLKSKKPNDALTPELNANDLYYDTNYNYPNFQMQLGVGSLNNIGAYRIDYESNMVIFETNSRLNDIQIEYLPMVEEADGYVVHPFFQEALIAWLKWQDSIGRPKFANERAINERDFDNAYHKARRAMKPFNVGDMYNQYRQSVRMAIKS